MDNTHVRMLDQTEAEKTLISTSHDRDRVMNCMTSNSNREHTRETGLRDLTFIKANNSESIRGEGEIGPTRNIGEEMFTDATDF
jgi:hypothetical protein